MGNKKSACLLGLLRRLNEMIPIKHVVNTSQMLPVVIGRVSLKQKKEGRLC